MTSFDYRMVEGPPLQYTYFHPAQGRQDHLYSNYQPYSYFDRFNIFGQEDMSENYGAASPNSTEHHSDSENSISSVEVSPRRESKNEQTVCRWKSCGLGFSNLELLANHVSSQHGASGAGGLYYCGWEGCTRNQKAFNARYKMLVHVRTHTNEKPHQCFQCPKSFSRAENLKIHIRSHSGEKPYICPVVGCGKAYSNSSDRFKHSRTHQVEKPYVCKVPGCTKRYTDPSSLRKHVKTYKHFANENIEAMKAELNAVMVEKQLQPSRPFCNQDQTKGYCSQPCCLSNTKSNEILRLGNLTFYQTRDSESVWNPYESKFKLSKGGILCKNETSTDIDMPLDLSVHSH